MLLESIKPRQPDLFTYSTDPTLLWSIRPVTTRLALEKTGAFNIDPWVEFKYDGPITFNYKSKSGNQFIIYIYLEEYENNFRMSYHRQYIIDRQSFHKVCGDSLKKATPESKIDSMLRFVDRMREVARGRAHKFSETNPTIIKNYSYASIALTFGNIIWFDPDVISLAKQIKEKLVPMVENIDLVRTEYIKIIEEECLAACH